MAEPRICKRDGCDASLEGCHWNARYCSECRAATQQEHKRRWRAENGEYHREYYQSNRRAILEREHKYYERNREKKLKYARKYYAENAERRREYQRKRYAENAERERQRARQYQAENPERWRAINARRRATKAAAFFEDVDPLIVLERWDGVCGICGGDVYPFNFELDHIVPLSRGGFHIAENLQPAHRSCNASKNGRLDTLDGFGAHHFEMELMADTSWNHHDPLELD